MKSQAGGWRGGGEGSGAAAPSSSTGLRQRENNQVFKQNKGRHLHLLMLSSSTNPPEVEPLRESSRAAPVGFSHCKILEEGGKSAGPLMEPGAEIMSGSSWDAEGRGGGGGGVACPYFGKQ